MSSLKIVSPPASEPIALATLKNHIRVTIADDDALIAMYGQAARELVESESGRSLVNKGYCQSHDHFPNLHDWGDFGTGYFYQTRKYSRHHDGHHDQRQVIKILRSPLVSIDRIQYIDLNGNLQILLPAPDQWQPDTEYTLGAQAQDANGNLQKVTAINSEEEDETSESGSTVPAWSLTVGGTTPDGDLTWTMQGLAPAGDFLVDSNSEPARVRPLWEQVWPLTQRVPNAVQIFFTAGYGDVADSAPATLKVALMESCGVMYQNREALTPEMLRLMPWYDRLIWSERVLDYAPTP